jgi:hypothetical protein
MTQIPMRIRLKWNGHQWWAYFNDYPKSFLHSPVLEDLCNVIARVFPKGSMAEDWRQ